MKLLASVVLSVAIVLGLVHYVPQAHQDTSALRFSTWQIQIGERGTCSGVLVKPHIMVTAAHCGVEGEVLKVAGAKASILKKDEKNDLMLLFVAPTQGAVKVAKKMPAQDTPVKLVGFPLGGPEFITEGLIQNRLSNGMIQFSAPAIMGNSGGPLFALEDGEWKVVSIASGIPLVPLFGMFPFLVTHMPVGASTDAINELLKVVE